MNKIVKSVRPLLAEADYASNVELLKKYTDYLDVTGDLSSEVTNFLVYQKNKVQSDFVTSTAETLVDINKKYETLDNQFLLPYIQSYKTCVKDIKDTVLEQTGNNSIYSEISDCIGLLGNSFYKLTDTVIPFNDIDTSIYGTPQVFPACLSQKVRTNTLDICTNLSNKTISMFRQNIINIQLKYATTTQSHGSNLITDINEYFRSIEYSLSIAKQLEQDFSNVFKIVSFFNTVNNNIGYNPGDYNKNVQEIVPINFNITYGKEKIDIDLLGKKINSVRDKISIAKSLASINGDVFVTPTVGSTNTNYLKATVKDPKSGKIVPVNTDAEIKSGELLTNRVPTEASKTTQEKEEAKTVIKTQNDKEKKVTVVKITEIPGRLLKLPVQAAQFSTQLFASATQSPLAAARKIRDLICKGIDFAKTFDLTVINNISWPPKLPTMFKSFSFKRLVMSIVAQVRQKILREIYKRIFGPLEAFYQQILSIKKRILDTINQIKDLFSCNKD